MHWKKDDGKPYQPSSYDTYLQQIASVLKQEGVDYCVFSDFQGKGESHAIFRNCLEEYRPPNINYGEKSKEAFMDPNADEKVKNALHSGALKPYHIFTDMVKFTLFCLSRFFV